MPGSGEQAESAPAPPAVKLSHRSMCDCSGSVCPEGTESPELEGLIRQGGGDGIPEEERGGLSSQGRAFWADGRACADPVGLGARGLKEGLTAVLGNRHFLICK